MKRASYREAIAWIALNDEPTCLDIKVTSEMISVQLISDLFQVDAIQIASQVVRFRADRQ